MDQGYQEQESTVETQLIKSQYDFWQKFLETKGGTPFWGTEIYNRIAGIGIDRTEDPDSIFTADEISVMALSGKLEEHYETIKDQGFQETLEKEKWIVIEITPKDPYRSKIIADPVNPLFATNVLVVCISNQGRAFEGLRDNYVHVKKTMPKPTTFNTYLKDVPERNRIIFDDEDPVDKPLTNFRQLSGQNFERLIFIANETKMGNVSIGETWKPPR